MGPTGGVTAMGGIGSGREPSGRGKLDDMPRVDIRRLHRGGHLEPGFRGVVPLQAEGREVGGVALRRGGRASHVRVGGSGTMIEGIPPKPKRMRWATYRRLVDEAQSAMHEAFRMTMADAHRLHRAIVGLPPAEDRLPHL